MSTYRRALSAIVLTSVLIVIIQGSLIAYGFVQPPIALAIVTTVLTVFAILGLIAASLLLFSFFK